MDPQVNAINGRTKKWRASLSGVKSKRAAAAKQPHDPSSLRTLMIAGRRGPSDDDLRRQISADEMPDDLSFKDAIGALLLDEEELASLTGMYGRVIGMLPFRVAQMVETIRRSRDFDVVFGWGEIPALLSAVALSFSRRPLVIVLLPWPSKPKKAIPLWIVRGRINIWLSPSPLQRRFLHRRLGVPAERLPDIRWPVDTRYWRPLDRAQDMLCAVGQEMRDYPTLLEALRSLGFPCHIAVGASVFASTSQSWYADLRGDLPAGITVGPKSYTELRELYARSRFVVVPLHPSDNDSGITAILEAMSMGRAVIVTDTPGQTGTLIDGVNCLRVPPYDAGALRQAIEKLWSDPELCARLGAAGRSLAKAEYDQQVMTDTVVEAIAAIR